MFSVEIGTANLDALEFGLNKANGRLSEDQTTILFQTKEDLDLYEKFLMGPSWDRFRLDEFVFQMLKFMDLDSAWHFFCVMNSNSKAPTDPYHGTDLTKLLLAAAHDYGVTGNHTDLRIVVLTLMFQSFNHSLGKLSAKEDSARAVRGFEVYLFYRYLDQALANRVLKLLSMGTSDTTREARVVRDLNRAVVALRTPYGVPTNIYDRLYMEQRVARPTLDPRTFLAQEIKMLAQVQFETSWARAVVAPVWSDRVIGWAAGFAQAHGMHFSADDLRNLYLTHQPVVQQASLTRPGSLTSLGSLS